EQPKDEQPKDEQPKDEQPKDEQPKDEQPKDEQPKDGGKPDTPTKEPQNALIGPPKTPAKHQLVTLGTLEANSPYRYLVTFNSRGATIQRIELTERKGKAYADLRYVSIDDESGYLGHLGLQKKDGKCQVGVVGDGTPAQRAGLKKADLITHVNGLRVKSVVSFHAAMKKTKPGEKITLTVERKSKTSKVKVSLIHRPLAIVSPEPESVSDPAKQHPESLLLALREQDGKKLTFYSSFHTQEWELVETETVRDSNGVPTSVTFQYPPDDAENKGPFKLIKRYTLTPTPKGEIANSDYKSYHLSFIFEIHNTSDKERTVEYLLDGPTGLPLEGWWRPMKVHPGKLLGGAGPRDVIGKMANKSLQLLTAAEIGDNKLDDDENVENFLINKGDGPESRVLEFAGVDTQYFSAMLLPAGEKEDRLNDFVFSSLQAYPAVAVSKEDDLHRTDISFQLISEPMKMAPGESESRAFTLFAGPKEPDLLEHYGLEDIKEYGWYGWISKPLTGLLHFFYSLVPNFAIAIIMLTVVVRLCMMPLSRKAVKNAEMMKLLQPEMKKIQAKYKKDMQKRAQAQRELFGRYNYNPMGGCMLMLLQLPVFIGLYRGLSIDNALRGEPLIAGLGWCSNLAAPDQFLYWGNAIPFLTGDNGFLGPYLNVLPLVTVALFIVQQKMLTPKAQDDQQRSTQRIMMFMTVFIGFLFFKVPAGLCIYFITSSLWGLGERKLLPKPKLPENLVPLDQQESAKPAKPSAKPSGNGASERKAKNKAREKLRQKRK
ncbi:MAG: membrane protein insertase YidC, partial [Planctomycetes bacterium]|nr:membrane protein insertase YidC [Planctomycetota bacterium]